MRATPGAGTDEEQQTLKRHPLRRNSLATTINGLLKSRHQFKPQKPVTIGEKLTNQQMSFSAFLILGWQHNTQSKFIDQCWLISGWISQSRLRTLDATDRWLDTNPTKHSTSIRKLVRDRTQLRTEVVEQKPNFR